jgi:predicted metal-binding membrane protein
MQQVSRIPPALERAVRHDRALVSFGLVVLTVLSWVYLARMAATMNASAAGKAMHAAMGMPEMAAWGAAELVMLFIMWAVKMVAMMLPSAAPIILLVVGTYRRRGHGLTRSGAGLWFRLPRCVDRIQCRGGGHAFDASSGGLVVTGNGE